MFFLQGILLVYDVTNATSFDNLEDWISTINKVFAETKKPHLSLVGNKGQFTLHLISSRLWTIETLGEVKFG